MMKTIIQIPHDVIAVLIGLVAISLNVLVLAALYHVKRQLTTHHRLIISLAISDIIVAGSVMFHTINKIVNPVYRPGGFEFETKRLVSWCTYLNIKALHSTGLNMTMLNLMLMATDHFVAVMKPLQYHVLMSKYRVKSAIVLLWSIAIVLGYSDFFSAAYIYHMNVQFGYNYCEVVSLTTYQEEFAVLTVAPVCLGVMFYFYGRIYMKIRRHRRPGYVMADSRLAMGRKTTKALITTLLNMGTFIITWLPMCLFQVIMLVEVHFDVAKVQKNWRLLAEVDKYLFDLLMFNAIADSIIYAVRVREVNLGLVRIWNKTCCCRICVSHAGTQSSTISLVSTRVMRLRSINSSNIIEINESII